MTRMSSFSKRGQQGVALLEALLAVVLLAIGLLGTLGLQASAYSALTEAGIRAEATISAERLLGMMTTDAANLSEYELEEGKEPGNSDRLSAWYKDTTEHIPGATKKITVEVTAGADAEKPSKVAIKIEWQRRADLPVNTHTVSAYI